MQQNHLKRSVGLLEAMTMVIGIVIGSGIFFKATPVYLNAGTPFYGIMSWIVGGIITMASALTISEIATAIPETGGIFVYLKMLYNDRIAFLFGWMQSILYVPGVSAALSIVLVTQATFFMPMSDLTQKLLAIFLIFFIILINVLSTQLGAKVQLAATIGKLIPIAVIIIAGLAMGKASGIPAITAVSAGTFSITGFGAAILGTLWAYDGWVGVGNMAGEMKHPGRDLPRAIILGLLIIIMVYILINTAIINVLPYETIVASNQVTSDTAVSLFGNFGASFISVGIIISILGALNGYLMTGVRIPFAMAQEGMLPFSGTLGKVDKKFGTPTNALIFQGVLASLYVLTGSFETLTNLAMFMVWVFFIMAVAGIFILRNKFNHLERPYKVPFYPLIPLVGIIGGLYVIVSTLIGDIKSAVFGIAITLIGLPIYIILEKKNK